MLAFSRMSPLIPLQIVMNRTANGLSLVLSSWLLHGTFHHRHAKKLNCFYYMFEPFWLNVLYCFTYEDSLFSTTCTFSPLFLKISSSILKKIRSSYLIKIPFGILREKMERENMEKLLMR